MHSGLKQPSWRLPRLVNSLAVAACVLAGACAAQQSSTREVEGYVTALREPAGFQVNGTDVSTTPETAYGVFSDPQGKASADLKDKVRVGAYVRVSGDRTGATLTASHVLLRDDSDKKLEGFGLIDKVVAAGDAPVFRADGYRIRISADTEVLYHGDLKSLTEVAPNTWMNYEGKRNADGVLVASRAEFFLDRPRKEKSPGAAAKLVFELSDYTNLGRSAAQGAFLNREGRIVARHKKLRLSDFEGGCGLHRLASDLALQQRVRQVGDKIVPAFEKEMRDGDPQKTFFRFYVVDDPKVRSDIPCRDGLVLVSRQSVARLSNDDQLAAMLADGVAAHLQTRTAKVLSAYNDKLAVATAANIGSTFIPGLGTAAGEPVAVAKPENETQLLGQRGRVALALMEDGGYDPWQAPEAWRLLAANPPADPASLKYPTRSGYQLGILYLQYSKVKANAAPSPLPPDEAGEPATPDPPKQ